MDISGVGTSGAMHAMSGASAGMPPQQKMSNLFDAIDTSGSGSISQPQFNQAFQAQNPPAVFQQQGANAIFAALDPNGTGSVSKTDFVSTMSKLMSSLRAEPSAQSASSAPSAADSLQSSLQSLNAIDLSTVPSSAAPGALFNYTA